MEYLIYISTAKHLLSDDELVEIYTVSREKNQLRNITGVLLYAQGTFIQLIEGPEEAVAVVFTAISKDDRHKNIIKLAHEPSEERAFPDWTMGFKTLNPDEMKELEGYFDPSDRKFDGHDHPGIAIIKTFVDSH
ncbi:BLUF domain-containing protein [Mucilaginibacter myungsuensis]|uniref:BLUF domain-containing protein n=1 Tax=Mucilaginibacter myungsuensis TaxID=649104 RepID=A0A929PYQ7_9SPHI|nr:BLUF domain-containing protein [Mucilaginibacter myungsuensis]MBE9664414.1 BLUF domain-containing protein [Mucilaginibacter myungsuensis]MDN3597125.1 BLUF domain-containing protein [Mucilaginibacter myungsuensis]